jgi:hypothetical protein
MKFFGLLLFSFLTLNAVAQPSAINLSPSARFEFLKTIYDFGDVVEGKVVDYSFKFTNAGTEPILISNVVTSCGCTITKFSREPIAPGKSSEITVTFKTAGRIGKQSKNIIVLSNAINPQEKIMLTGNVLPKPWKTSY